MLKIIAKIFANSPPAILLAFGGIGFLLGIQGAGVLLGLGFLLQLAWLIPKFI